MPGQGQGAMEADTWPWSKLCPEDEPPAFLGGRFFSREMGPEPCQTYPWAAVSKKGHSGGRGCEMA